MTMIEFPFTIAIKDLKKIKALMAERVFKFLKELF